MTTDSNTPPAQTPTPDELDSDPTVSFWLKRNWRMACERDPFDATRDAAALHEFCRMRLERVLAKGEDNE